MPGTVLGQKPMTQELTGTTGKPVIVVLLNGNLVNLPSKYVYTHKLMLLSTLVRKVSLCSGQWLRQTHTWSKC